MDGRGDHAAARPPRARAGRGPGGHRPARRRARAPGRRGAHHRRRRGHGRGRRAQCGGRGRRQREDARDGGRVDRPADRLDGRCALPLRLHAAGRSRDLAARDPPRAEAGWAGGAGRVGRRDAQPVAGHRAPGAGRAGRRPAAGGRRPGALRPGGRGRAAGAAGGRRLRRAGGGRHRPRAARRVARRLVGVAAGHVVRHAHGRRLAGPADHYRLRDAFDAGYHEYVDDDGSVTIPARALVAAASA